MKNERATLTANKTLFNFVCRVTSFLGILVLFFFSIVVTTHTLTTSNATAALAIGFRVLRPPNNDKAPWQGDLFACSSLGRPGANGQVATMPVTGASREPARAFSEAAEVTATTTPVTDRPSGRA